MLVVTETNSSADNIARSFRTSFSTLVFSIGSPFAVAKDLFDLTLEGQVRLSALARGNSLPALHTDVTMGREHMDKRMKEKILRSARVLNTTCTGAGAIADLHFNLVVIDEATLATEPESLIPLACCAERGVLIADQNQLGPFDSFGAFAREVNHQR